jgi:hypothetical protein
MGAAYLLGGRSPTLLWVAGCTGKQAHPNRKHALERARANKLKFPPYKCQHCGLWHLTSVGKKGT